MNRPLARRMVSVWLLALAFACGTFLIPSARAQTRPTTSAVAPMPAVVIALRGEIDDYNKNAFERRFATARADGAKVVIVRIDTYGGLVTAGLDLSRFIKNQSDIHTIAYVDTKAISAGAMIAMACDEIVMADDAVIGDCAPISISRSGELQPLPAAERAKMESPILADFQDSAMRNHHDPLLAAAMVKVDTTVFWLRGPDGEKRFVDEKELKDLTQKGWNPVDPGLNPVDSDTTLLTLHTALAVKLGLATGRAATVQDLASDRHLDIVANLEPNLGEDAIDLLNDGVVRMVLLIVFCITLFVSMHAPGHGMAEVIATCALALLVGVPLLTGYATWWEILIIFVGLALMALEIFVLPHAGLMLVLGGLMMVGGFVLTFVGREPGGGIVPHMPQTWTSLEHGLFYVTGALGCSMAICWWASRHLPSLPILNRLVLTATSGGAPETHPVAVTPPPGIEPLVAPGPVNQWPLIGMVGRAITPLRPGGSAEFYDEIHADNRVVVVSSESGYVPAGASIMVREVDGSRVKVRAI